MPIPVPGKCHDLKLEKEMTDYSRNSFAYAPTSPPRFNVAPEQSELTPTQVEQLREHIGQCHHSIIVFGSDVKPILLNQALRENLSEPTAVDGATQPKAFVWQTICETVANYVTEGVRAGSCEIAEAFPIQRQCIAAVGSILRNGSGRFLGAIVNIADLSGSGHRLQALFGTASPASATGGTSQDHLMSEEDAELFQTWMSHREQASRKMSRLSRREDQVVSLVSDGLPNKSIARELDISVKTIEKHRANATRKLGVNSTPEMVRIAVIAGNKAPDVPPPAVENPPVSNGSL